MNDSQSPDTNQQRRLLILANSIKNHGRCVAGREIQRVSPLKLGGWIRPISKAEGGALSLNEVATESGSRLRVYDDAIAEFKEHRPGIAQPENWLLADQQKWKAMGRIPMHPALSGLLEESPATLWGTGESGRSDKVALNSQELAILNQSLVIIRPKALEFHLGRKWKSMQQNGSRKTSVASFEYRGHSYKMPITDDIFTRGRFRDMHPVKVGSEHEIAVPAEKCCLLCVSLTEPFMGFHYKVIATILEEA